MCVCLCVCVCVCVCFDYFLFFAFCTVCFCFLLFIFCFVLACVHRVLYLCIFFFVVGVYARLRASEMSLMCECSAERNNDFIFWIELHRETPVIPIFFLLFVLGVPVQP